MPTRWGPASRSVRVVVLAIFLFGGALFAAWVVPGLTWQRVSGVLAQAAPAAQTDSPP